MQPKRWKRSVPAMPQIMSLYDQNGWEMGMFYLENGHAEIRGMLDLKEEFDA